MSRNKTSLIGILFLTVFAAAMLLGACQSQSQKAPSLQTNSEQPNVIILFADDLGYGDLGSYGSPSIKTPHLDMMAKEGQRWTDFYVASSVCSPSRGSLMTGNMPERSGLYGKKRAVLFPDDIGRIPDEVVTLPETLKDVGYSTSMLGKWHLGDRPDALPTRHGFDSWLGVPYSNDMDWAIGLTSPEIFALGAAGNRAAVRQAIADRKTYSLAPKNEYWNIPLFRSRKTQDGYSDNTVQRPALQSGLTELYTQEAVKYIEEQAAAEMPFFLYVAYAMPHVPLFPGDGFAGKSAGGRYGDTIEELDWSAGEIRETLERLNLDQNTLVVFTSDNGPWLTMNQDAGSSGPFKDGKQTTFEGGMRVPAIVWGPGIVEPNTIYGMGSVVDLYATIMAMANAPLDARVVDSIDLSPTFTGSESPRSIIPYYRQGELYAFRKGTYKAHFITQGAYGQPPLRAEHNPPQLYNLGQDPGEKFDIAQSHPEILSDIVSSAQEYHSRLTIAEPIFDQGR